MANGADVYESGEDEVPQINGKKPRNIFLDHFNKLTSVAPKIRLKSGCQIIRHLGRNNENDEELKYTLGRLIRGLGSSKTNSRIGFYTTFVVLLKSSSKVDVNDILDVVQKELKTSGQNLKSENADVYTGLILVCGAVLQSGKFSSLDNDKRRTLFQHLVDASTKKSYLGLLAASMIIDALPKLDTKVFSGDILPVLRPALKKPLSEYTIDQLYLLFKLEEHFPTVLTPKLLGNLIKTQKILTESNVKHIVHVLLDVQPSKSISAHPIYAYLAKKFIETSYLPTILDQLDAEFEQFTYAKHQVLPVLLKHIVDRLSEEENAEQAQHLPAIFGKNLLINTARHFKTTTVKQQDEIKQAVVNLLNATSNWSKTSRASSEIKVKVMERLMFYPGVFTFEKITGNKVLQSVTSSLDVDGVKRLAAIYRQVMLAEVQKKKDATRTEFWTNLERIYASQLIVKLINHPATKQEQEWRVQQLLLLLEAGLLKKASVGGDVQKNLKETFFSALDCKFGKLQDVIQCSSKLVHALNENMSGNNLRQPLEGGVQALWDKSLEMIEQFEGKAAKKQELNDVFHVLFLQMSLQLFNDEKLAGDSLNELFSCYANCKRKAKDEELAWIEVVVDLFLNLLSHSSHLLRRVIGAVFPHLCKHLTTSAIHQVLHVLDPKSEANPLSADVDDSEDDDEEDDKDEEECEEEETDEDDDDDDDDDEEVDTQNDQLRLALQDVLMKTSRDDDDESIDLDNMSDSEADKLNAALGEAFKRFRPETKKKSKKQSKDDATLTHFRVRVMDLIDVYLDSPEVSMINALEIMLPLLQTLEFSIRDAHQKPLHDRIKSSLKKLSALKTFASVEDVDENVLHTLLQSILDKGTKSSLIVQEMGDKIADCSMFIINCSSLIQATKKVSSLLVEIVDVFFKKRDCLTPYALFKMILASNWKKCVELIGPLISYVFDDEIRPFRRRQALELLKIFYFNNRLNAAHKDAFEKKLAKCEGKLREDVMRFLEAREYRSKEPFVVGVFLLLAALKNSCLETAFDWAKVGELAREYRSGIALTGDGKAAFVKLCHALKVSNVVKMQAKTVKLNSVNKDAGDDKADGESEDEDAEREKAGRQKNKGEKEPKKLRKEARTLRMQSLSEGLAGKFDFARADVDELNENGVEDDDQSDDDGEEGEAVKVRSKLNGAPKNKRSTKKRTTSEASQDSPTKKKKKKQKAA